jgi:uncharacterized protein (TIGR02271 family)
VRREELVVERTPVDHGTDGSIGANGARIVRQSVAEQADANKSLEAVPHSTLLGADEEVLRVPLLEEQVVITLRPVVREEVLIRKRRVAEQQVHSIDLNHEVLQVDRDGEVEVQELKGDEQEQAEVG